MADFPQFVEFVQGESEGANSIQSALTEREGCQANVIGEGVILWCIQNSD